MHRVECDAAVIGGGPAGLGAAASAKKSCSGRVILMDRDRELGGILQQCIHNGFGLQTLSQELTGPEYAEHYIDEAREAGVEVLLDTMVLELAPDRRIYAVNRAQGMMEISAKAVVLAMGCRERNRGAITIPGSRPAGVFTAGAAQRFVNMEGYMPGKRVVILGSGDVGLIMARRLTWEGAKVEAVLEILPFPSGLTRNIVQCLDDQGIPLYLGHTVVDVHGDERVTAVTVAKVDEKLRPIPGTEWKIPCDTLLLSIGLIPENELTRAAGAVIDPITQGPVVTDEMETSIPGVFACGNVVQVHDLVDNVTREAWVAGEGAGRLVNGQQPTGPTVRTRAGDGVRYVVPQVLHVESLEKRDIRLFMRVARPAENVNVEAVIGERVVHSKYERVVRPAEMVALTIPLGKVNRGKVVDGTGNGQPELLVRITPRHRDGGEKA
ncbi:MAG: FAD-dependent oxidoreductase [Clostridia bacterium]|nr:FAD-dependent oxidoreductase [Clostridia bacterium]